MRTVTIQFVVSSGSVLGVEVTSEVADHLFDTWIKQTMDAIIGIHNIPCVAGTLRWALKSSEIVAMNVLPSRESPPVVAPEGPKINPWNMSGFRN